MSDKEPSALPIPLVSESAGELEREPLHPRRWENSSVGLPQSLALINYYLEAWQKYTF